MSRREKNLITSGFAAGIVVLVATPWLLGPVLRWLRPTHRYHVMFSGSVNGLLAGAPVDQNGVAVGKVVAVQLTPDTPPRVAVEVEVARDTSVQHDSAVTLASTVDGALTVEITGGTAGAGRVPNHGEITAQEEPQDQLGGQVSKLARETRETLWKLSPRRNLNLSRATLNASMDDFRVAGHSLREFAGELKSPQRIQKIDAVLENMARSSERLSRAMDKAEATIDAFSSHREELYTQVNGALTRLNRTLDGADRLAGSANKLVGSADSILARNTAELERAMRQLNQTSRHLDETVETIQANPSSVLWGRGGKEAR